MWIYNFKLITGNAVGSLMSRASQTHWTSSTTRGQTTSMNLAACPEVSVGVVLCVPVDTHIGVVLLTQVIWGRGIRPEQQLLDQALHRGGRRG